MTLTDLILNRYERSEKGRKGDTNGNASFRIEEQHYSLVEKSRLIEEAMELEVEHLLKIHWVKGYFKVDIEKVEYHLTSMENFYHRAGRIPIYQQSEQKLILVSEYYQQLKSPWLRRYTEEKVIPPLQNGTNKQSMEDIQILYKCFAGLDQMEAPLYKRIFSKRYLGNSKIFENDLQDKIIRIARKYHEEIEDTMEDKEVLSQLYIEDYAQELSIKGSLRLSLTGNQIDTGVFHYGTVLNTQTLKNAVILANPQITRILTIENKANFIEEPFEEGTLILFSHGYFTPLEREFLKKLRDTLTTQNVTYHHSGDFDYGGVRIFRYIRERIFPELEPYHMDIQTYIKYLTFGEPLTDSSVVKLRNIEEPLLQEVINRMIETGLGIEQEAFCS